MKEHAYHGYQIVKKIPFLAEASEIVYSHQERFDGTGYPRGLKGEEIPLGARIFSVADTLDAITVRPPVSARAVSTGGARAKSRSGPGGSLIPEVVKVFLEMPDKIWEDLRKDIRRPDLPGSVFRWGQGLNPFAKVGTVERP